MESEVEPGDEFLRISEARGKLHEDKKRAGIDILDGFPIKLGQSSMCTICAEFPSLTGESFCDFCLEALFRGGFFVLTPPTEPICPAGALEAPITPLAKQRVLFSGHRTPEISSAG